MNRTMEPARKPYAPPGACAKAFASAWEKFDWVNAQDIEVAAPALTAHQIADPHDRTLRADLQDEISRKALSILTPVHVGMRAAWAERRPESARDDLLPSSLRAIEEQKIIEPVSRAPGRKFG
jgi:hypothetical protein